MVILVGKDRRQIEQITERSVIEIFNLVHRLKKINKRLCKNIEAMKEINQLKIAVKNLYNLSKKS